MNTDPNAGIAAGYAHPLYAESLAEFGKPFHLTECGGWILERQIPGTVFLDAMGSYPLFFCDNWEKLPGSLQMVSDHLVAVSLVIGPFSVIPKDLFQSFFDVFRPYKDHYILDLSQPLETTIANGHRRNASRALRKLKIDVITAPDIDLDEWVMLYEALINRHRIEGIRKFSRSSFEKQIKIPNTTYFRVRYRDEIVGGNIFFIQGQYAYAHLAAFTDEGYELGAPYAVKWHALQYLANRVHWVNFGGSTGESKGGVTGLDYFKQGWSSQTGKSYFCGKILNQPIYGEIVRSMQADNTTWFPAYRLGNI